MIHRLSLIAAFSTLVGFSFAQDEAPAVLTPAEISDAVKNQLPKVRDGVISLKMGGTASGAVISPDGWVITAGHVLMNSEPDAEATVRFEDGTEVKAIAKGYDLENDFGLLKLEGDRKDWPHVELASESVPLGGFIFTMAHPSGYQKGRAAQTQAVFHRRSRH